MRKEIAWPPGLPTVFRARNGEVHCAYENVFDAETLINRRVTGWHNSRV